MCSLPPSSNLKLPGGEEKMNLKVHSPFWHLNRHLQSENEQIFGLLFVFVHFKGIRVKKTLITHGHPQILKSTINGLALKTSLKVFRFHLPSSPQPATLFTRENNAFASFFSSVTRSCDLIHQKTKEERKRAIFLLLFFHSPHTPQERKLFPFLLFVLHCSLQNYKWELDNERGGGGTENGERNPLPRCFSLFFSCTSCRSSHTPHCHPFIMRQTAKKIQLCQRQKAMVFQFRFSSSLSLFSPFEEDSLFRVVDDDQLFISVAAKRRWSSTPSLFSLSSID